VLREGSRVTGSGAIELLPGRPPRLCFDAGRSRRRPRPAGTPCGGIDLRGLAPDVRAGDLVTVVGTLRGGIVEVEEQALLHEMPFEPFVRPPVPCPEPRGGWAPGGEPFDDRSPDDAAYNAFLADHQELAGACTCSSRRRADRSLPCWRATRPNARWWSPSSVRRSAVRLCVVVADHDVDAAPRAWDDLNGRRLWGVGSAWTGTHERLRQVVHVELLWVTEEAAAFVAAHPDGVVQLEPHLRVLDL
jgi:hypothetical protein